VTASADFVIDASVALAWGLRDEASEYSDRMLERLDKSKGWAPDLWPHEVANGLTMAERRSRITPLERAQFVDDLLKLPIEIVAASPRIVLETQAALADRYQLSAYDAAYLDLALRLGLPLATQDKKLAAAAGAAGVALARTK